MNRRPHNSSPSAQRRIRYLRRLACKRGWHRVVLVLAAGWLILGIQALARIPCQVYLTLMPRQV